MSFLKWLVRWHRDRKWCQDRSTISTELPTRPPEDPCLTVGDVTIDLVRRVVIKAGAGVHLTPTAYNLLRVLAANAGRFLTHGQLLARVWGSYASENSQQLCVYINYLRRKLPRRVTRPIF